MRVNAFAPLVFHINLLIHTKPLICRMHAFHFSFSSILSRRKLGYRFELHTCEWIGTRVQTCACHDDMEHRPT